MAEPDYEYQGLMAQAWDVLRGDTPCSRSWAAAPGAGSRMQGQEAEAAEPCQKQWYHLHLAEVWLSGPRNTD